MTKAFADFRRTHQDNWAAHRERFTAEQQEILSRRIDWSTHEQFVGLLQATRYILIQWMWRSTARSRSARE